MPNVKVSSGVVHKVPVDVETMITQDMNVHERWESITPLARNEWICWVEDAKKPETRERRIKRISSNLKAGKKRPCCWPGCPHR